MDSYTALCDSASEMPQAQSYQAFRQHRQRIQWPANNSAPAIRRRRRERESSWVACDMADTTITAKTMSVSKVAQGRCNAPKDTPSPASPKTPPRCQCTISDILEILVLKVHRCFRLRPNMSTANITNRKILKDHRVTRVRFNAPKTSHIIRAAARYGSTCRQQYNQDESETRATAGMYGDVYPRTRKRLRLIQVRLVMTFCLCRLPDSARTTTKSEPSQHLEK